MNAREDAQYVTDTIGQLRAEIERLKDVDAKRLLLFRARNEEIERLKAERKNCPPASESEYVRRLENDVIRYEAALEKIASYYAHGAVRLNSDVDVPEIARDALKARNAPRNALKSPFSPPVSPPDKANS